MLEGAICWLHHTGATEVSEIINYWVLSVAAIAGGLWAAGRYYGERTAESALTIELQSKSTALQASGAHLVFIEATLHNVGKRRIKVARHLRASGTAYCDSVETIPHSGTLEIKALATSTAPAEGNLDWFDDSFWHPVSGLEALNMLSEYEQPDQDNALEFWMEPNEAYALGRSIALSEGIYLAKFTFVGKRSGDFWTRLAQFAVPSN